MSSTGDRILALGQAARDAFNRGEVEEGVALVQERGRALSDLTALEIGHAAMAQIQNEDPELRRAALSAQDAISKELRRSHPRPYPVAG